MEKKLKIIVENCPQNHKCPAVNVCPVGALTQKDFLYSTRFAGHGTKVGRREIYEHRFFSRM